MAEGKYDRYFIHEPIIPGIGERPNPRLKFNSSDHFGDKNFSLVWNYIDKPCILQSKPHTHDFDQFLHFYGADGSNVGEFEAEVEITLGEVGLTHIITNTTIVHVPKGMIHCPLNFKRVDKPIIFMNVALTPQYNLGLRKPV